MSRKRKSDQPTIETEAATATAIAEPEQAESEDSHGGQSHFAERVAHTTQRMTATDPFKIAGDYLAGIHLFESRQDRQVAIKFDDKPGQPVIDKLKDAGYRWNPSDRIWTHPVRPESAMGTRIEAERLYQEVREMTRQEKGIDTSQEVPF